MRTQHFLLATEKEVPNEAELVSHQLMIRAGLIRQLASGLYTWLPTGLRVLQKVEAIVREEMNRSGASELQVPHIVPLALWAESGRAEKYGPELLRFEDRHQRGFCFGPTHEEVLTDIARKHLKSYKQLPINLYQIQTKFRDEIRPRFGLMRAREFLMKDAYSFHLTKESLAETYQVMQATYSRIFNRLGLQFRVVEADSGAIGGDITKEFQVLADAGEDDLFYSDQSDYAANVEKATCLAPQGKRPPARESLKQVATPEQKTIAQVCDYLQLPIDRTVKTLVVKNADAAFFAIVLRGDHQLNEIKLSQLPVMLGGFSFASEQEIQQIYQTGLGYLGPVNSPISLIVDRDAAHLADFCCGANKTGAHFVGTNWQRDISDFDVVDLRNVVAGDLSPDGQGVLHHIKGIEVGHIFQVGDHYSQKLKATVLGDQGKPVALQMGCYGLGVSRVVAAAIEQSHDHRGIIWPQSMAPFQVCLVPMKYHQSDSVKIVTDQLYQQLLDAGVEVLLDDRDERPGAKFADMDLIGIPHRLVIGDRGLAQDQIEYKARTVEQTEDWPLDSAFSYLLSRLTS